MWISILVFLGYLFFYTGYNKNSGRLDFDLLKKVILLKDKNDTVLQFNKLISLVGIT